MRIYEGGPTWGCVAMVLFWLTGLVLIGFAWGFGVIYLAAYGLVACMIGACLTVLREINRHDQMVRREIRRQREREGEIGSVRKIHR